MSRHQICKELKEGLNYNYAVLKYLTKLYEIDRDPRLKKSIDLVILTIDKIKQLIAYVGCEE